MSISLRDNRTRRICFDAMMVALAMMLSYLEVILPFNLLIPLPGFRLGLANVIVLLVFALVSPIDAAIVSAMRIFLMGLLFGSATSFYFSAMGGFFAFLMLVFCMLLLRRSSFFGVSVLCAASHNCGQILAAASLFGSTVIFSYLPLLLIASAVYGGVVGVLLNLLMPRMKRFFA